MALLYKRMKNKWQQLIFVALCASLDECMTLMIEIFFLNFFFLRMIKEIQRGIYLVIYTESGRLRVLVKLSYTAAAYIVIQVQIPLLFIVLSFVKGYIDDGVDGMHGRADVRCCYGLCISMRWISRKKKVSFLGSDIATTIVDTSRFPEIVKAYHIYSCDDDERNPFGDYGKPSKAVTGKDMGVYNLELKKETIFPSYQGKAFKSKLSHPTWIFPSFHLCWTQMFDFEMQMMVMFLLRTFLHVRS